MIFIQAILMTVFPFWRVSLPPEALNLGARIEIIKYEKGAIVTTESVESTDPKYQTFLDFLKNSKKVWKLDIVDYAPKILVKSNGVTMNCFEKSVVIYFLDKDKKPTQLSRNNSDKPFCGLEVK